MTYSFKSVGKTQSTVIQETPTKTILPIGIKTPLRKGTNSLFEMHTAIADQVADNFRNLLLTNWGERLGTFDFGANLRPILANFTSLDDFDSEAMKRISDSVAKWMPYIDLEDFSSTTDRSNNRNLVPVILTITYNIQSLNVKKRVLQLTMYAL